MKKVIALATVVAALASCQSKANKAVEAEANNLSMEVALITKVIRVYEDTFPAADGPGIDYVLTLNVTTDDVNATYTLDMIYPDAEGQGKNRTFSSKGKQQIAQRAVNKRPTKAVKLTLNDGEAPMYFVIVDDTTLCLVNDNLQEVVSDLDYDITKVKEQQPKS